MNRISTGDGRVHFACTAHINKPAPLSAADASWLAGKADVVTSGGKGFGTENEAIFAAAGTGRAPYTKSGQTTAKDLPEAEYSHKRGGERRWNPTWKVWLTQPDSAWRERHLAELKRLPAWSTAVFSDSAGKGYAFDMGGKPAKPPGFTVEYTPREFLGLVGANLDYWASTTGKRFLVNGLGKDTVDVYRPTVGMVEGAFGTNRGVMPSQAKWEDTAGFVLEAQAKGWTPWVLGKLAGNQDKDPAKRDAWRALLAPSMLLLDAGSLLFDLCGMEGSDPPWVTREYDHPSYAPGIGYPKTVPSVLADLGTEWPGVYRRLFSEGSVWVNSTTSPVAVSRARTIPAQSGVAYKRRVRKRP